MCAKHNEVTCNVGNEEPSGSKEGDDVGRPPVALNTATGNLATAGWDSGPNSGLACGVAVTFEKIAAGQGIQAMSCLIP
jgi:hypothetical protein